MDKYKEKIIAFILTVLFIISIFLVIIGQRNVGPGGLMIQLIGIVGIIIVLFFYNLPFKD